jgi:hypothetical protein
MSDLVQHCAIVCDKRREKSTNTEAAQSRSFTEVKLLILWSFLKRSLVCDQTAKVIFIVACVIMNNEVEILVTSPEVTLIKLVREGSFARVIKNVI